MDAGAGVLWHGDFFSAGGEYEEKDFPLTAAEAQAAGRSFGTKPPSSRHNTPIQPSPPPPPPANASSDDEEAAMPGLEEMSDSEDESDEDDEDSDVDELDGDALARLANRLPDISPPSSPPDTPHSASPSPSPSSTPHRSSPIPSLDYLEEEFGRVLTEQELDALHQQLAAKPVVTPFPEILGRPGAPVDPHKHRHAYEKARDALGEANLGNPWSPLTSGLEWDLARWAKLRGPSSTALTELLKIDGVSQSISLYLISWLTAPISSVNASVCPSRPLRTSTRSLTKNSPVDPSFVIIPSTSLDDHTIPFSVISYHASELSGATPNYLHISSLPPSGIMQMKTGPCVCTSTCTLAAGGGAPRLVFR